MKDPIKVLIVDDDPVIRALLQKTISSSPEFIVVGTAVDAFDGRDKIVRLNPDLMTLDIEMPKLDGVTFLRKVMAHRNLPTIIISSLAHGGSEAAMAAIEAGAADAMPKPVMDRPGSLESFKADLLTRLRGIASRGTGKGLAQSTPRSSLDFATPTAVLENCIVAIGASTGGTEAIRVFLEGLAPPFPPVVIVQHMPALFTKVFAANLAKTLSLDVIEGRAGDVLKPGRVILAPGDFHMEVKGRNGKYTIALNQQPAMHGVRPAVDYLFKSIARAAEGKCVAAVLTGMGRDGADGAVALKQSGCWVIAQDEKTSIAFGMPKSVIDAGAADEIKPISGIAEAIRRRLHKIRI